MTLTEEYRARIQAALATAVSVEVTFQCEACGESETRIRKRFPSGRFNGATPRLCAGCQYTRSKEHQRKKRNCKPRPVIWTEERKALVTKLWLSEMPLKKIAEAIGGTNNMVIGIAARMGLSGQRPSQRAVKKKPRAKPDRVIFVRPPKFRRERLSPAAAPPIPPLNISLIETTTKQCKHIAGEDDLCCAHPTWADSSWCAHHYVTCYVRAR